MKRTASIALFATLVFLLSSCSPRRSGWGYGPPRPYSIYPSHVYNDAPGGWDVYKGRGSTRVKYTE